MNVDVPRAWHPHIAQELTKPYFRQLATFVDEERRKHVVFPPEEEMWTAFSSTPFDAVRVVWLGQDPYPTVGQAHGLSFSVKHGQKTPASLSNMFREATTDVPDFIRPPHGCLDGWAHQGVFLLNTILTVREGEAGFPLPSVLSSATIVATMPSKQVTDRQKSARAVAATAETHAQQAATKIGQLLSPHLHPGETFPNLALIIKLLGRHIAGENESLVSADISHEHELADDAAYRDARESNTDKVRVILVDLRSSVEAIYGAPGLHIVRLVDAVPTDPSVIATTGRAVLEALKDTTNAFPAPHNPRLSLDRNGFATDLEMALPPLESALESVANEAREAEVTLMQKRDAMMNNDRAFSRGASTLTVLFALAGLDDAASKVRPSGRKPGRTVEAEEPDESSGTP